jgi:hypothetical protein
MELQNILPRVKKPKSKVMDDNNKRDIFHTSAEQRVAGFIKTEAKTRELKLDTTSPKMQIVGKKGEDCGTDPAKDTTIIRYSGIWKAVPDYCIDCEDLKSGMILYRNGCPENPFPMSEETARYTTCNIRHFKKVLY